MYSQHTNHAEIASLREKLEEQSDHAGIHLGQCDKPNTIRYYTECHNEIGFIQYELVCGEPKYTFAVVDNENRTRRIMA